MYSKFVYLTVENYSPNLSVYLALCNILIEKETILKTLLKLSCHQVGFISTCSNNSAFKTGCMGFPKCSPHTFIKDAP